MWHRRREFLAAVAVAFVVAAPVDAVSEAQSALTIRSSAFKGGGPIPVLFTCDGANLSPPLAWSAPPKGTRSFALLVDDPDAPRGTFRHWTAWGISPTARGLGQGKAPSGEGVNDAGRVGYLGPCPPSGDGPHRYRFRLHALDTMLKLPRGASKQAFGAAIRGHVLAAAQLAGSYER